MKYWLGIFLASIIGLGLQLLVNGHPTLFFGLFVFVPHLLFAITILWLSASFMRLRGSALEQYIAMAIGISFILGSVAAMTTLWNDGAGNLVLTPNQAGMSFLTAGVLPWKDGGVALLRFFPFVCAMTTLGWAHKRGMPLGKTLLATGLTYASLWAAWHVLTFTAVALKPTGLQLETAQDAFSAIVRAQTGGYWSNDAVSRFLAPVSDQGKSVSMLLEAAYLYVLAFLAVAITFIKGMGFPHPIWKRFAGKDLGTILAIALGCCALGQSLRVMARVPFSVPLAIGIMCLVIACLGIWVIMRGDVENIRSDEAENPRYPLPSGAMSVMDAEQVASMALGFALYGALLLGWPAAIGLAFGVAFVFVFGLVGLPAWQRESWSQKGTILAICFGIAWIGLAVGLQDLMSTAWLVRLALGLGCVGAGIILIKGESPYRIWVSSGCVAAAGLVSGQWLIGIAALATLAALWFMEFRETSQKRLIYPIFALFGWYIFALIFFPSAFART